MAPPITLFHSPDADDVFMFYGLTSGAVSVPGYDFLHAHADIETLNQRARRGELDCTALSVHAFAYLGGQYQILRSGSSMGGKDYGPRLVAKCTLDLKQPGLVLAIPGELTSAALALRLFLRERAVEVETVALPFDKVQGAVLAGEVDGGVIIHEGQLTYLRDGLTMALDLGAWWWEKTETPLPLGITVVRKSLGNEAVQAVSKIMHDTIAYSLAHREEALTFALSYGKGLTRDEVDRYVAMYVNDRTVDMGEEGMNAVRVFLKYAHDEHLIPSAAVDFASVGETSLGRAHCPQCAEKY